MEEICPQVHNTNRRRNVLIYTAHIEGGEITSAVSHKYGKWRRDVLRYTTYMEEEPSI